MTDYIDQVFGAGGLLAQRFHGYEPRSSQIELARFVDRAFREERHALAEAPCGTGKSIGYCVPAIYQARHRGKKVVISTANIALQEQLLTKDLPMLQSLLPWPFTFAALKGRNQYLCAERLAALGDARQSRLALGEPSEHPQLAELRLWALRTETGDRSELPYVPLPQVWSRVSTGSSECRGSACSHYDQCFAERARSRAAEADIVVVNHHLLFAALASPKLGPNSDVLPADAFVILDEAHEAAEIARDKFGFTLTLGGLMALAKTAFTIQRAPVAKAVMASAERFFQDVARATGSHGLGKRLEEPGLVSDEELRAELQALIGAMREFVWTEPPRDERDWALDVVAQTELYLTRLSEFLEIRDWERVYWVEPDGDGVQLRAKAILVDEHLAKRLFGRSTASVLVSATLAVNGDFSFARHEVGMPATALELAVPSPFDFARQALVVVPSQEMPLPSEPSYPAAVARAMQRVMDLCGGRTLCLFTSYEMLNYVRGRLRGHRLLCQGDMPRSDLLREFRGDVRSVLLGTSSFWTGVDVQGDALTAVVIDKLPFPHPDDPLMKTLAARSKRAFWTHSLPRALITLRQGVGRLIRARDDIGVVVLLDRRALEKSYAPAVRKLFSDWPYHHDIEMIPEFLEWARGRRHARAS